MNVLVIYGHPSRNSFNGAILDATVKQLNDMGHKVTVKDLYGMKFNPVLTSEDYGATIAGNPPQDVAEEQEEVKKADAIIMISPVWWHSVTSMLRGYIDRVFTSGFAYAYTPEGIKGQLKGKIGLLITTSGADRETDQATHMTEGIREAMVNGFFAFCGFDRADYINFFAVPTVSDQERKQMLEEVKSFLSSQLK